MAIMSNDMDISDVYWRAIALRDPAFDGQFYYSVKTTGVYCRPSCGARRARRENVAFYATATDAERAGFRPCKRCRPNEAPVVARQNAAVAAACRDIEAADAIPRLDELAQTAGMSAHHFHRVFKAATGVTPRAYAAAHRTKRVRSELSHTDASVSEAIYESGFNSSGRFYEAANGMLGMTPSEFKRGGKNATIRFAVGECSLGSVLAARSEKGVCAILLGDDPDMLVRDLQDRFPEAELVGGDAEFEGMIGRVVALVEQPSIGLDLPLDIRGTAFQQRVWQALRAIPAGGTASYMQVASAIGAPKAVRAVAQACAANALAVAIPCHRVVRNDGSLSGYRWGVERKHKLLDREAEAR